MQLRKVLSEAPHVVAATTCVGLDFFVVTPHAINCDVVAEARGAFNYITCAVARVPLVVLLFLAFNFLADLTIGCLVVV